MMTENFYEIPAKQSDFFKSQNLPKSSSKIKKSYSKVPYIKYQ